MRDPLSLLLYGGGNFVWELTADLGPNATVALNERLVSLLLARTVSGCFPVHNSGQ